jgi:vacuolar protein sorting-associated protein 13D
MLNGFVFRGDNNDCLFLRVDIVLQTATFFIVFSDAYDMPPPYRIDNYSEVGNYMY